MEDTATQRCILERNRTSIFKVWETRTDPDDNWQGYGIFGVVHRTDETAYLEEIELTSIGDPDLVSFTETAITEERRYPPVCSRKSRAAAYKVP